MWGCKIPEEQHQKWYITNRQIWFRFDSIQAVAWFEAVKRKKQSWRRSDNFHPVLNPRGSQASADHMERQEKMITTQHNMGDDEHLIKRVYAGDKSVFFLLLSWVKKKQQWNNNNRIKEEQFTEAKSVWTANWRCCYRYVVAVSAASFFCMVHNGMCVSLCVGRYISSRDLNG